MAVSLGVDCQFIPIMPSGKIDIDQSAAIKKPRASATAMVRNACRVTGYFRLPAEQAFGIGCAISI